MSIEQRKGAERRKRRDKKDERGQIAGNKGTKGRMKHTEYKRRGRLDGKTSKRNTEGILKEEY